MRATNGFGPKWGFAVQFNSTAAVIAAIPHAPPPDPTHVSLACRKPYEEESFRHPDG
jgi:hypothetical protein